MDLRRVNIEVVRDLCERFHGYGSASCTATYAFAAFEADLVVAAYAWQPPPHGAAKNICPEAPHGVLALSRMVAVPKTERHLKHVSKPLRRQMKTLINRGRWPVLVTYSDEGQGHTGYVYQCSGFEKTIRTKAATWFDVEGRRVSRYANGKTGGRDLKRGDPTRIQRWEHWQCERGKADAWIHDHGYRRVPTGRVWRSGNAGFKWVRVPNGTLSRWELHPQELSCASS
ncbi:MAG: hypothetical protein HC882_06265 [Acidobacteria bacterium]|nr:hypothetical protein [Acidobacteriota bacterium]